MVLDINIGDGADALAINQLTDALDGTYWVSGWDATLGTGDLEVDIAAGEGAIGTIDVETESTQTVDFDGDVDADNPRKAVISVDDTGTVQKTLGDAMPADPENEVRERTFDPQPPTNAPGVVVAVVWLAAGAASLVSDDIQDRRLNNEAVDSLNVTPNEPDWTEDANSPQVLTGDTSYTYTFAEDYDRILVYLRYDQLSQAVVASLRINGEDSDDYRVVFEDGSSSVEETEFRLGQSTIGASVIAFELTNPPTSDGDVGFVNNATTSGGHAQSGNYTGITQQPIDTIELFRDGGSGDFDITIEVFGRNVGD